VLDPVMVATSGDVLLERDAVRAIATRLVPLAALVTPNLDEAAIWSASRWPMWPRWSARPDGSSTISAQGRRW
jgi:hydroxymethylpyrimidine/phosphomethylpyrimidine kinase